ncbi:MAG: pyruvate carboxylase subunit B [Dehalococcoidales bacterium]|nr:pyruvate carboxylase subunit B [Dehalococcoidales bacterium]
MNKNPLKITDVTMRDGHQSLLATRMRTEDMIPIVAEMDKAGFYSLEVWGGATFDVPTRFLNEDPWERLSSLKWLAPKTPLQMLLRGQNIVGYRNYADDVVEAFVRHAARTGIDIFRIFDALNDERNFETALKVIKECGKHTQLSLCYSLTEPRMGGPVYNLDYYINKAIKIEKMGADSLCIKDMAGLIAPDDAYTLIKALKNELKIPIQLHTHYTSGMASMSILKAIEAGVDIIDTTLAPFALRTSHPAVEPITAALQGTSRDTGLDMKQLVKLGEYFESIAPKYRDFMTTNKMAVIDTEVLIHQVPGGMISNFVSQLKESNALDRIGEVYAELPKVRKELGYPPLVTPTSQIVGIQAVQNVLFGRYKVISAQVKDYVYGLYGQPPVPIAPEIQKLVLKGYERGETPITQRPGDILKPEMDKAFEDTKHIARNLGDVLIYALYPTTGMRFLKWKYGIETPPPETKGKTLEDIQKEDELIAKVKCGKLSEMHATAMTTATTQPVEVKTAPATTVAPVVPPPASAAAAAPPPRHAPAAKTETRVDGTVIAAPMPGLVIRYTVNVGDEVREGDIVVVIEAMKMAIDLPATVKGKVKAIKFKAGDHVSRDDVLAIIG